MNRTIRNLIVAAPLATIALTLVPVGAATAGPNGPVVIIQPNGGDPEPDPEFPIAIPEPKPEGPQDKAPLPQPKGPQDKAPQPQGGEVVAPTGTDEADVDKTVVVESAKGSPDSIDHTNDLFAGDTLETELVADENNDGGLDLTWLLVGGGIVTASGIAFAARKREQNA